MIKELRASIKQRVNARDAEFASFVPAARSLFRRVPETMVRMGALGYVDPATRNKVLSLSKSLYVTLTTRRTAATVMDSRAFDLSVAATSPDHFVSIMVSYWHSLRSEERFKASRGLWRRETSHIYARVTVALSALRLCGARLTGLSTCVQLKVLKYSLLAQMPSLESLSCRVKSFQLDCPRIIHAHQLKHLRVNDFRLKWADIDFLSKSGVLSRLHSLDVTVESSPAAALVIKEAKELRNLQLLFASRQPLDVDFIAGLAGTKQLTTLLVTLPARLIANAMNAVASLKLPSLQSLSVCQAVRAQGALTEDEMALMVSAIANVLKTYDKTLTKMWLPPLTTVQMRNALVATMDLGRQVEFRTATLTQKGVDAKIVREWLRKHPLSRSFRVRRDVQDEQGLTTAVDRKQKLVALGITESKFPDVIGQLPRHIQRLDLTTHNQGPVIDVLTKWDTRNNHLRSVTVRALMTAPNHNDPQAAQGWIKHLIERRLPHARDIMLVTTPDNLGNTDHARLPLRLEDVKTLLEHPTLTTFEIRGLIGCAPTTTLTIDGLHKLLLSTAVTTRNKRVYIAGDFASVFGRQAHASFPPVINGIDMSRCCARCICLVKKDVDMV